MRTGFPKPFRFKLPYALATIPVLASYAGVFKDVEVLCYGLAGHFCPGGEALD
jgi:hypothetical protein